MRRGDHVTHPNFGTGRIEFLTDQTVIVRFADGLQEVTPQTLKLKLSATGALEAGILHPPIETITRLQALTIDSINDTWGVFSRSRINLLPHQLWVCRKVLERWPARWLVADDVGLGKTIEAGLILWPTLSKGLVRRLLILCPASLVDQWQYRLRTLFDIRITPYLPQLDTPKSDFWGGNDMVIASLQTLREDRNKRHERFLGAEPWDLVVVDEAHHLNADEKVGMTLAYDLLHQMQENSKIKSMVFFTGTPHRGKDHQFWMLLKLLRPDLFDPGKNTGDMLSGLKEVLIRNNKGNVTDLEGNKLFKPPIVKSYTYQYTPEEEAFYALLTEFIRSGKLYAENIKDNATSQVVMLILISMQKLASSSIAAIRSALKRRLHKLRTNTTSAKLQKPLIQEYLRQKAEQDDTQDTPDPTKELENLELRLMQDEQEQVELLLEAAEKITAETKILTLLETLETHYQGRTVLFFTEYKATQALLLGALQQKYGPSSTTFINGDEGLDINGVWHTMPREKAAEQFNTGEVRFLVSTEAAGEGIDLQQNCHTLIHVDLPWNPMRMHQRVGRINRYGQKEQVEVITLRNPDTVEDRIWEKLNEKIATIMRAFDSAMEDPEDLMQLILGMARPRMFDELFAEAESVPTENLQAWFNARTQTFGGVDAVKTIQSLVGNSNRFDYGTVIQDVPRLDLADLKPFFVNALLLHRKKASESPEGLSFTTPEEWKERGIHREYTDMVFDRSLKARDASERILGVGHKLINQALRHARTQDSFISEAQVTEPTWLFSLSDRVTENNGVIKKVIFGVQRGERVLRDTEVLTLLNSLKVKPARTVLPERDLSAFQPMLGEVLQDPGTWAERLGLEAFAVPTVQFEGLLVPEPKA